MTTDPVLKICENFIHDMQKSRFSPETYLAMLCGSSLSEANPRDTDIFIYTLDDDAIFFRELTAYLSTIDSRVKSVYLRSLEFYSVKYESSGICYSLHIVSQARLFEIVRKAGYVETYTDISVFDVKLYSQTVYRKWILETRYLIGNPAILETVRETLLQMPVPRKRAEDELISRIRNNIGYFNEKVTDDAVLCNLITGQIINNLINYLYLVNECYYGTLKYIRGDLEHFRKARTAGRVDT